MTHAVTPESRLYRHPSCNAQTEIRGQAFETLSNPFLNANRAWCQACQAFFPLSDFEWADTGEQISAYYIRHSARATWIERFLCSQTFMIVCAIAGFVAGATIGYSISQEKAWVLRAFISCFVGGPVAFVFVSLREFLVTKLLVWRVCGVGDSRLLK